MTRLEGSTGFVPVDGGQIFYEKIGQGRQPLKNEEEEEHDGREQLREYHRQPALRTRRQ